MPTSCNQREQQEELVAELVGQNENRVNILNLCRVMSEVLSCSSSQKVAFRLCCVKKPRQALGTKPHRCSLHWTIGSMSDLCRALMVIDSIWPLLTALCLPPEFSSSYTHFSPRLFQKQHFSANRCFAVLTIGKTAINRCFCCFLMILEITSLIVKLGWFIVLF
jgi:hypothetical protein